MAEFGAAATLEVTIPDKELREAQAKIESELGGVSVNVDAQPSRQSPGAMTDGGFGDVETLMSAQLEQLEDIHDELEKMGASGGPGGGGAGSSLLMGLGARSVLGGIGGGGALAGGATALGAGGIALGGGLIGRGARNVMQGQFPESYAPQEERISGTSYAYSEEGGIGGSAEPLIKPEQMEQMFQGIDMGLESQKPEWISELENFQLTKPQWVGNLDQQLQIDQPKWLSNLNPFGGGGGGNGDVWSNVPASQQKRYQDSGSGGIGDINVNVGGMDFNINPDQLQSQIDRAIEDQKQQIVDETVSQVEQLLPDFGSGI